MKHFVIWIIFSIILVGCQTTRSKDKEIVTQPRKNEEKKVVNSQPLQKEKIDQSKTEVPKEEPKTEKEKVVEPSGQNSQTADDNKSITPPTKVEKKTPVKEKSQDLGKINSQIQKEAKFIEEVINSNPRAHPAVIVSNFSFSKHLKFLVQQKTLDYRGYNVLMMACDKNYPELVESILEIDSNPGFINRQSTDGGKTALMIAAGEGSVEIVQMLLSKGADRNIARDSGEKAIDFAKNDQLRQILSGPQRY